MGGSQSKLSHEDALLAYKGPQQTYEVGTAETGSGAPRRNVLLKETGLQSGYKNKDGKIVETLWEVFQLGRSFNGDANFLGTRNYTVATPEQIEEANKKYLQQAESTGTKKVKKSSGYVENDDGTIKRGDYVWDSYNQVNDAAQAFGRGLAALGAKKHDNMGIFSINRAEWIIASLGFYTQNLRTVSLYATLGPDAVEYIINHAETRIVIVSKENLGNLLKTIPKIKDTVKNIIVFDPLFDGKYGNKLDTVQEKDIKTCEENGIKLLGMTEVIALGNNDENKEKYPLVLPEPDDLAFIMYTSGTTGIPKGAMLTHKNIIAPVGSVDSLIKLEPGDSYFSYLPLAHIFETVVQCVAWAVGGCVYFSQGDIRRLVDDLSAARPHLFAGVPRVFLKFYQNIWANVEKRSFIARWYIKRAYAYQCSLVSEGKPLDKGYDEKVFKLMREKVGLDRVKAMISGAAPCPAYLCEFMRVMTNSYFAQGYGMTESSAGTCVQRIDDYFTGEVGPPLNCCDIKLADVPDLNYFSTDQHPRGEVLISGPSVFAGYYKNEEATKEALIVDNEGRTWLCTGDVGRWNPNGTLSIIDRKKNMIKLAQGEYVAVEKVEDIYGKAAIVSQVWCYGNSYKSMLIGVVVPNVMPVYEYAVSKGWWNTKVVAPTPGALTDEVIAEFDRVVTANYAEYKKLIKDQLTPFESELLGFEKMKDFLVESRLDVLGQGFSEDNGLLTPTMKKKRKPLSEYYLDKLKKMYTDLGEAPQDGEKW